MKSYFIGNPRVERRRNLSRVCRRSKSLWFGTDQHCLEDEGVVAWVCDEEDGEGLMFSDLG